MAARGETLSTSLRRRHPKGSFSSFDGARLLNCLTISLLDKRNKPRPKRPRTGGGFETFHVPPGELTCLVKCAIPIMHLLMLASVSLPFSGTSLRTCGGCTRRCASTRSSSTSRTRPSSSSSTSPARQRTSDPTGTPTVSSASKRHIDSKKTRYQSVFFPFSSARM